MMQVTNRETRGIGKFEYRPRGDAALTVYRLRTLVTLVAVFIVVGVCVTPMPIFLTLFRLAFSQLTYGRCCSSQ